MTDYVEIHLRPAPGNAWSQDVCDNAFDRVITLAQQAGFSPQEVYRHHQEGRKSEVMFTVDVEISDQQFDTLSDRAATLHQFKGCVIVYDDKTFSHIVHKCHIGTAAHGIVVTNIGRREVPTPRNRPRPESQGDSQ